MGDAAADGLGLVKHGVWADVQHCEHTRGPAYLAYADCRHPSFLDTQASCTVWCRAPAPAAAHTKPPPTVTTLR